MDEAKAAIDDGLEAAREQPEIHFAGYLQDAQKEYAEARVTEAVVLGGAIPTPEELGVEDAPYLNGIARRSARARHILDLLRHGKVAEVRPRSPRWTISTPVLVRWTTRTR